MNLSVRSAEVLRVRVPLKLPFVTALGRKTETENVRVALRLACGAEGWGEASSSVVQAHLKPARIERVLGRLAAAVLDRDARRWRELGRAAFRACGPVTPAAAAVECALLDALAQAHGLPLARLFGGRLDSVETDITLSAWPAPQAAAAARDAVGQGFKTLKIKVGTGPKADLARVRAAAAAGKRAAGGSPAVLLDGNQGMSVSSALRLVDACLADGIRVELLEQPLPRHDVDGQRRLSKRCPVPLAADESARSPEEALEALRAGAARAINVKAAKTGIAASLEIIAIAQAAGAGLMIGCMQETSVGLSPSIHLACGTGAFHWVDLDSDVLLAEPAPGGPGPGPRGRYRREGPRVTVA